MAAESSCRLVGRYAIFSEIAAGGMASVHLGRLMGPSGFSRVVALKRLHAQFASDPPFVASFLDEARLAGRIRHPNVVSILDVVSTDGELLLVMDYVQGETLSRIIRTARSRNETIPLPIVSAILSGVLRGLDAAHDATNEAGEPLGIVHRDISPQNILVGADGVARVLDFGIAKAAGRAQNTSQPTIKGKIAYMPPEQASAGSVTRRTDIYAAGIVLWESLTLHRLFEADDQVALLNKVLTPRVPAPSTIVADLPPELDAIAKKALQQDPDARFATAREMAAAIEACVPMAPPSAVAMFVEKLAGPTLARRAEIVAEVERTPIATVVAPPVSKAAAVVEEKLVETSPATHTLSTPVQPRPARWPLAVLGIGIGVAAISMLAYPRHEEPAPAAAVAPKPKAEPAPSATSSAPIVTASAPPPPPVSVTASAPAPKSPAPKAIAPAKTATAAKANCNPPYVVDSLGRHRYLPECL